MVETIAILERIAAALEELAKCERLSLKLRCYQAETTPEALAAAEAEGGKAEEEVSPSRPLPVPMELLQQSPLELLKAETAYAAAEQEFGLGKVPAGLDLGNYAEEKGVEIPAAPRVEEIWGPVPPKDPSPTSALEMEFEGK